MIKFLREIVFLRIVLIIKDNLAIYFVILLVSLSYFIRAKDFLSQRMYYLDAKILNIYNDGSIDLMVGDKIESVVISNLYLPNFFTSCSSEFKKEYMKFLYSKIEKNDLVDIKILNRSFFRKSEVLIFKDQFNINDIVISRFDMMNRKESFCNKLKYIKD